MEDCSWNCGSQARTLNRKITQVLMEVLVEKEWIWWNGEKGQVATASERRPEYSRTAKQFWRMGYGCGSQGARVQSWRELEEQTFPQTGEGRLPSTKSRSAVGRTQDRFGYSCSAAGECTAEAIFCCPTENSRHLEA
jgi:hypothetical protein